MHGRVLVVRDSDETVAASSLELRRFQHMLFRDGHVNGRELVDILEDSEGEPHHNLTVW